MANVRLGLGDNMTDELIKKACSMAMKAHKSPKKAYLVKKSRSLLNIVIFSFPGCWCVNDWFTGNAFGEKKIDPAQFSSLKSIATEEVASVNEAFLNRFQVILPKIQHEVGKFLGQKKQIVFSGHSSGGPIAILMTVWVLQEQLKKPDASDTLPPLCMTFGSPLVGDHIFNHALSRENWLQYFTHFVMRYDIVPRILLAPLSSIKQELILIPDFLNPRSTFLKQESSIEASTLYFNVMMNVSSLASHAAYHLMGNSYNLLENFSIFIELSPYRPFGTYIFCTGCEELVVVKNPDAVLQYFFYSSQLHADQEGPVIPMRSIKDHHSYHSELQTLDKKKVFHLDSLEGLPLSSDGNDVANGAVDMVLNMLGLSTGARLCLMAARESEKRKLRKQEKFNAEKTSIKTRIDWLENYKARCKNRKVCYYDAFKISMYPDDFGANVKRLELAGIFDELIEMIKNYELPDSFEGISEWMDIGTRYRRLVEPLDIASYYRHLNNTHAGPYIISGRPRRYIFTQKWLEYAARMGTGSSFESCFWAEVEELDLCLKNGNQGLSDDVKERISLLEKSVEAWVSRGELGPDVFFEDSTFIKWWTTLTQQFQLESCLSKLINSYPQVIKYDVFLSFRGEDTQNNFTSHLHAALSRAKIETFTDEELVRGDQFSPLVLKGIEESIISIIIFSEGYASSRWCLGELVKILECKKKYDQVVIPIYYQVDPLHVRDQTGSFGDAFAEVEKVFQEKELLQQWRNALREAANLFGFDSSNENRSEAALIEEVIEHILKILNDIYPSDNKDMVGVHSRIENIESLLCIGSKDICIVGIWGKDGIGKTTIAMALFNKIKNAFENSYFALNVGENPNGLICLRQELLSTILKDQQFNFEFTFMKQRLGCKKVLIVFDDVTSLEQLQFLIGDLNYFGFGSRIIITTRDMQVLKNCGVDEDNIYRVEALFHHEALQLFSWYAFEQNRPLPVYNELSNKVVKYTGGVPLALKVLGSFLRGRTKKVWERTMDKLKGIPHINIQEVLKVCYDGLDDDEKNIFLDIACFIKHEDKDFVISFLDGSGFFAEIGISVLVDKCFITLSNNKITMHGLHRQMGWEIVKKESLGDLGKCSRLWQLDEILHILQCNMENRAIEGICLDMSKSTDVQLNLSAFAKMHNLQFLKVCNSHCEQNTINITHDSSQALEFNFTQLRYLCWHGWPLKSFPSNCYLENLVAIDMPHSNVEELWTGVQDLFHLRRINLCHSKHLHKSPDLSHAPNLESLILEGCISLSEICSSIHYLNSLAILNLRHCKSLCRLPVIPCNVEELFLDETSIEELPIENLSRLVTLHLNNCSGLKSLPSSICKSNTLECLNLSGCSNLDGLPYSIGNLESLKVLKAERVAKRLPSSLVYLSFLIELNLADCCIMELPSNLGHLSSLESLVLSRNNFEGIPSSIKNLSRLIYLDLSYCKKLQSLPKFPCQLQYIAAHDCTSLEALSGLSILFLAISTNARANFLNCSKLCQKTIISIWKDFLQIIHERMMEFSPRPGAYICFPGTEIPEWFAHRSMGSSINFKLESGRSNARLVTFALSTVVKFRNYHYDGQGLVVGCKCKLLSRDVTVALYYGILPDYVDLDHVFLGYDFHICSFDIDDNQCNANEVSIQFYVEDSNAKPTDCCEVKSCGVHFLYHQEIGNPEHEVQAVIDGMVEALTNVDDKETEIARVDEEVGTDNKNGVEAVTDTDDKEPEFVTYDKVKELEAVTDRNDDKLLSAALRQTSPPRASCIDTFWRTLQQKGGAKNDGKKKSGTGAKDNKWISQLANMENVGRLEEFSSKVIRKATKNFSADHVIGRGGFGIVYRAILEDGRQVAIKRPDMSRVGRTGHGEVVLSQLESLSRVNHKNLVRLLGFCEDGNDFILVFEYMANGTLRKHLDTLQSSRLNSWPERIKVALHVARGIEYLHQYATPQIIHSNIKPSNILLDNRWIAKVSGFGLSVVGPGDDESGVTRNLAGTFHYMDPEYVTHSRLTTKSDVYGFGVVLLELLSGREAWNLMMDVIVPCIIEGEIREVLDPKLPSPTAYETEAVASVAYLAAYCVARSGRNRPSMTEIVSKLQIALDACSVPPSLSRASSEKRTKKEIAGSSPDDDKKEEALLDVDDGKETEIATDDKKEMEAVIDTDDDKETKAVAYNKIEEMDIDDGGLLLSSRLAYTPPPRTGCIDTLWHQVLQRKGAKNDGRWEDVAGRKDKKLISQLVSVCFVDRQKGGAKNEGKKKADDGAKEKKSISLLAKMGNVNRLEEFSLEVLLEATKNFSKDNMVGRGGFGTMYHATLSDGRQCTIKRVGISDTSARDDGTRRHIFLNELEFLSCVHHKNLVRLLGFCEDGNVLVLVYEYMVNGTLRDHLLALQSSQLNSWPERIKVALHAAKGIQYLHEYAVQQIIHLNIKSSNILLDHAWTPKVSGFGLSVVGPGDDKSLHLTTLKGTYGYIDPEYIMHKKLSTKSDVYSFGVVLLELLSGCRPRHNNKHGEPWHVVGFVPSISQGEIHEVLDPRVPPPSKNEIEAVASMGHLAADCVAPSGRDRPSMTEVVSKLQIALNDCLGIPSLAALDDCLEPPSPSALNDCLEPPSLSRLGLNDFALGPPPTVLHLVHWTAATNSCEICPSPPVSSERPVNELQDPEVSV